jgi:carbon monoxide dehydrogenase subunit G
MINLHNEFRVALPIDQTWALLTDLPQVAACLPGAHLDDVTDGEYRGGLSTKIGPISARYRGVATFREHDEVGHRAVIEARGREEKGSGSANALITAVLKPDGDGTLVVVATELAISGRAAQFGRSLLAEVSNTMVDEFVRRLETMISGDGGPAAASTAAVAPGASSAVGENTAVRGPSAAVTAPAASENSLDVVRTIALPLLRKAGPYGAAVLSLAIGLLLGRRSRPRGSRPTDIPLTYVLPYPGVPPLGR